MTRVLFVGQQPETVDFTDPILPAGMNAERINAGIALALKQMAQAVWKGVGMRGIVSATPISRSWGTDLNRTGSLTAPDAPWGVCSH